MCGFAGVVGSNMNITDFEQSLNKMGESIQHRGPDDHGIWIDQDANMGLVHRRLSILDLSPSGFQPMISPSGRYTIVFNGEIYNFKALRILLERQDYRFQGNSDTEVLLASFEVWGVERTLQCINGMFAIALWDCTDKRLILARDRLGEKPLYYGRQGEQFLFGSELKALMSWPGFRKIIDEDALALYLRLGYVPGEYSIFKGIHKLLPGHLIELDRQGNSRKKCYWSAAECIDDSRASPFQGTEQEALDSLDTLLCDSVAMRMESDVPLGGFLSGGIDSSLIAAVMQQQSSMPVKTFTVGFHDPLLNEAEHAKTVAAFLGTEHTEIYLNPDDALSVVPLLPELFDEPFADESQIPTFMVAQEARKYVTVALSGDGGDEVFAGYNRHINGRRIWNQIKHIPYPLRSIISRTAQIFSNPSISQVVSKIFTHSRLTSEHINKVLRILNARKTEDVYWRLITVWDTLPVLSAGKNTSETLFRRALHHPGLNDISEAMMSADLRGYLPDDILVKTDRALMGVSLEGRVPLLDHRVVEFGWRLPVDMKIRNGQGKWLLRQLLYKYIPEDLVNRPKMGFNVPLAEWLRGPLYAWAKELLDERFLREQGLFDYQVIHEVWKKHCSGAHNYSHELWHVLMFQAWYKHWMGVD